jgi:hypothetical protein
MKIVVIILLIVGLAQADQYVPIPKTPYGF